MLPYIVRRLLASLPVVAVVLLIVFFVVRLVPGDPATLIAGHEATQEEYRKIKESLGLDKPIGVQLREWTTGLIRGDFGDSIRSGRSVLSLISRRLEPSLSLMLTTEFIVICVAIPLGVAAAWKANSLLDRGVMVFAAIGYSVPVFWLGFILIWIFGLWAFGRDDPILPVARYVRFFDDPWEFVRHLILPAFCLGLISIAAVTRMTRASVLEVLREDYVRTARAKGLAESVVLIRHALRNAGLPIMTIVGLSLAGLFSGAVVTENVFAIPGVGRLAAEAIQTRDYPIVQGLIILFAAAYVYINLLIDILYAYLDPRIRY